MMLFAATYLVLWKGLKYIPLLEKITISSFLLPFPCLLIFFAHRDSCSSSYHCSQQHGRTCRYVTLWFLAGSSDCRKSLSHENRISLQPKYSKSFLHFRIKLVPLDVKSWTCSSKRQRNYIVLNKEDIFSIHYFSRRYQSLHIVIQRTGKSLVWQGATILMPFTTYPPRKPVKLANKLIFRASFMQVMLYFSAMSETAER